MAQKRPDPFRRMLAVRPDQYRQHNADLQRRREHGGEKHQQRDALSPGIPEMPGAFEHRCEGLTPDYPSSIETDLDNGL